MSENQKFKLKYDELRDGNPAEKETRESEAIKQDDRNYQHAGQNRNLAFAWPDGRLESFNYAYLVSIKFEQSDDRDTLTLTFTSNTVTINGYNLKPLFWDVFNNRSRVIEWVDLRYTSAEEQQAPLVVEILIHKTLVKEV